MSDLSKAITRLEAAEGLAQSLIPPEAARLPILLWRMGLGWLIGQFVMLISTVGRRSGQVRRAAPPYFFVGGKKYVLADPDAQWYQNLQADPHATIQTAYGVEGVIARRVSDSEEMSVVFVTLMHNRPLLAERIAQRLGVQSVAEDLSAHGGGLPLVAFEPTGEPTPAPLQTDLRWALPAAALGLFVMWRLGKARRR